MAGIGVKLNRIFGKNTIATSLYGFGYSMIITIAPMLLVITAVMLMQILLGFSSLGYADRELYVVTVLYIFIFGLLTASPLNAVLSKYMSDAIYRDEYDNIMPCFYLGLGINVTLSCLVGIPFCIWEHVVGHVAISFVFMGFCGYIALMLVFYTMLYLSICKDYKKISLFFFIGMLITVLLSLVLVHWFNVRTIEAMLASLDVGFMIIGWLEFALIRNYFPQNSGKYRDVFHYLKKFWLLIAANFLYTLGLYIHNFVFWATDMRAVVVNTFVCMYAYDMASCLAMFSNISASVIFITRVEMHFHERYKRYTEAVIGGRGMDIENAKKRMFSQLAEELMNLVRIQFIVSAVLYLVLIALLPRLGFGGLVMKIFPSLMAGYFNLFIMYSAIIFLYYYQDLAGSALASLCFCLGTFVGAVIATHLTSIWYGIGPVIGGLLGWFVVYHRLRMIEKNLDVHIFCSGSLMKKKKGKRPSNKVYDRSRLMNNTGMVNQEWKQEASCS